LKPVGLEPIGLKVPNLKIAQGLNGQMKEGVVRRVKVYLETDGESQEISPHLERVIGESKSLNFCSIGFDILQKINCFAK